MTIKACLSLFNKLMTINSLNLMQFRLLAKNYLSKSVFEDVQKNSEQIWKSLMYFLVVEFQEKTLIPPPFIIFHPIYYALRRCCKTRRSR
uniref:Uncharacterized protein n=1 Tax=Romanomermis culicivorax TaxID=13658 RepID=A0A915K3X4_ROMCU